ncbi:unnamed protein product [Phytophthora fragariaefolia]|uniref:Unnamed protein product n=1 Tax=Phytophthora fragariaefolia TaxID=1490495 RepID=A0A9W6XQH6_9STRA|nr:unnamed protein product [Phytophthora fragariaefolia]
MQIIHDNVTVLVTQRELQSRAPKADGSIATTSALQYVAVNAGFDTVTFRVDFSESLNIRVHCPAQTGGNTSTTLQKSTSELAFECELYPLERRVFAYVIKKAKKRAFVRVHYALAGVSTPSIDAVVQAQQESVAKLQQAQQHSNQTFSHISKWKVMPCQPDTAIQRACAEVNRYFQDFGEVFMDSSFPPAADTLYTTDNRNRLSEEDSAVYTLCSWGHLHNIVDQSWVFAVPPKPPSTKLENEAASFKSGLPGQDTFLCALSIIAPFRDLWFRRWFSLLDHTSEVEKMTVISVALCHGGVSWQNILIDLFFPTFPLGRGLMTPHNTDGELYAALLQKAYAKLRGSYASVSTVPAINVLQELTGYPWCVYLSSNTRFLNRAH